MFSIAQRDSGSPPSVTMQLLFLHVKGDQQTESIAHIPKAKGHVALQ